MAMYKAPCPKKKCAGVVYSNVRVPADIKKLKCPACKKKYKVPASMRPAPKS